MAQLTEKVLQEYVDKMGNEEIIITAAILVQVLNKKYKGKSNDKEFKFNDIQQYYLRGKLPAKYSGLKLKFNKTILGNTLTVFAKEEEKK